MALQENLASLIGENLFTFAFLICMLLSFCDQDIKKQFLIFKGHNITSCFLFYNQTKAQILLLLLYDIIVPQPQRIIILMCCQNVLKTHKRLER